MAKKSNLKAESLPLTPEEMKAIGEIELGPSKHEQFLNNHYKKLIVVTLIIMLAAVVAIVYGTWRARQEADGAAAVMAAIKTPTGVVEVGEYDPETLEQVIANYPGTKAAATAETLRGMQMVAGGQEQQGVEALEKIIQTSADSMQRVRAQAYLAGYYMSGGDTEKATALWQAVVQAGKTPWEALALLSLGDMAKQADNVDLARSYYEQLRANCPSSPLQVTVQQRILLLGVDAPKPVAPEEPKKDDAGNNAVPVLTPAGLSI